MIGLIDLHTHTTASDGTDTPQQLLEKARAKGIRTIALTDHDTVAGVKQVMDTIPEGITLIPGIEFSSRTESGKCHILGYGCNMDHPAFQETLREGRQLRETKLNARLIFLWNKGIRFPDKEVFKLFQLSSVGKPHLGNLMVKYGYAEDKDTAIREVINLCPTGPSRISAEMSIHAILVSGGIPVWAHPLGGEGEKAIGEEKFEAMLHELTSYGLKGLECFYSKYAMSDCERLAEIANKYGLLTSGGSDYHGTNKTVQLGTLNADGQTIPTERITLLQNFV